MALKLTVFKNVSKKNGKVYYVAQITQIVHSVVLKLTCYVEPHDFIVLKEYGVKVVDMTKKQAVH